jgi:CubicO group peptidase (beta-lactamase class C family)
VTGDRNTSLAAFRGGAEWPRPAKTQSPPLQDEALLSLTLNEVKEPACSSPMLTSGAIATAAKREPRGAERSTATVRASRRREDEATRAIRRPTRNRANHWPAQVWHCDTTEKRDLFSGACRSAGASFVAAVRKHEIGAIHQLYDAIDGQWSRSPAFPAGGAGLVSTVDDFARFSRFLLAGGLVDGKRLLSAASIRQMTSDQLTSAVKARGGLTPGFFDRHGWGFCTHVVTERDELGFSPGSYGWNGGLGTSWYVDPTKQLAGILLTNRAFESPDPPPLFKEFWRTVNA